MMTAVQLPVTAGGCAARGEQPTPLAATAAATTPRRSVSAPTPSPALKLTDVTGDATGRQGLG
jgi:hypothetical protein